MDVGTALLVVFTVLTGIANVVLAFSTWRMTSYTRQAHQWTVSRAATEVSNQLWERLYAPVVDELRQWMRDDQTFLTWRGPTDRVTWSFSAWPSFLQTGSALAFSVPPDVEAAMNEARKWHAALSAVAAKLEADVRLAFEAAVLETFADAASNMTTEVRFTPSGQGPLSFDVFTLWRAAVEKDIGLREWAQGEAALRDAQDWTIELRQGSKNLGGYDEARALLEKIEVLKDTSRARQYFRMKGNAREAAAALARLIQRNAPANLPKPP
jgi:hypothetical protein